MIEVKSVGQRRKRVCIVLAAIGVIVAIVLIVCLAVLIPKAKGKKTFLSDHSNGDTGLIAGSINLNQSPSNQKDSSHGPQQNDGSPSNDPSSNSSPPQGSNTQDPQISPSQPDSQTATPTAQVPQTDSDPNSPPQSPSDSQPGSSNPPSDSSSPSTEPSPQQIDSQPTSQTPTESPSTEPTPSTSTPSISSSSTDPTSTSQASSTNPEPQGSSNSPPNQPASSDLQSSSPPTKDPQPTTSQPSTPDQSSSTTPSTTDSSALLASTTQVNIPTTEAQGIFACPTGYSYLSYDDITNIKNTTCPALNTQYTYRLTQGGSISGADGCVTSKSNPNLLTKAICANTSYSNPKKISRTNLTCPAGTVRATIEEATTYRKQLCNSIGKWDILRIGVQGTLRGSGYNCELSQWDTASVGDVLCITKKVLSVQYIDANENVCGGTNSSLYTVQEALANLNALCAKIPANGAARLAGGSTMYGSDKSCMILDVDRNTTISQALCGPLPRPRKL